MNYNINLSVDYLKEIEKSVLCSLIVNFDENKIEESLRIINENDFYDKRNSIVYKAIVDLYVNEQEVNEFNVFLENQILIDEEYYLNVIASTPQTSITNNLKKIKEYSLQRQMIILAAKIKEGDFFQITKLHNLKEELENLENIRDMKKVDDKFEKLISSFDLDIQKIKDKKIEYLYRDFIIKNDITMIVSRPGIGKSLLSVALCNMFLSQQKIGRVLYLDGDNSELTVKSRNIHVLKEKYENKLNYFVELSNTNFSQIISELKKKDLTDFLIVLDSIKNFIIGDRNSHKDVTEFMNILKLLRKNGASIIFLHHQNKLNKEFNSAFAGSSAFAEDIALAFELKKNYDKQTYIFVPIKDRNNISNYIAFNYNNDNTLEEVDVDYALETNEDVEIKDQIINFIKSQIDKPIYSDILKHLVESGYNKDRVNKIIQNGKNKLWKSTQIYNQNNKTVFELIDSQDNQDKSFNGRI